MLLAWQGDPTGDVFYCTWHNGGGSIMIWGIYILCHYFFKFVYNAHHAPCGNTLHIMHHVGCLINIQSEYMTLIILIYFRLHSNIPCGHKEQHKSRGSVLLFYWMVRNNRSYFILTLWWQCGQCSFLCLCYISLFSLV